MKYLKYFKTEAEYTAYKDGEDFVLPNVSYTVDSTKSFYNPYVKETRLVCTYNVTDTTNSTPLCYSSTNFTSMEVDGVLQNSVTTGYTFNTLGEHTIKFELTDPTSISDRTFQSCTNLTSITIPDSVTTISSCAFQSCTNLTSITVPDSVTTIGNYAFQASGLTTVYIGSGGASIGESAFNGCSNLTSVEIISGIIGERAFQYCSNLTSVKIKAGSIKYYAFPGCSNITSLELGEGVTEIGEEAFVGCRGLISLVIPDSVTSIGEEAFRGCSGITSLELGTGLTEIGCVFNCQNLSEIICLATIAPSISSDTFQNVKTGGILKVPTGSDYSSWISTEYAYLGYYNWTIQYI